LRIIIEALWLSLDSIRYTYTYHRFKFLFYLHESISKSTQTDTDAYRYSYDYSRARARAHTHYGKKVTQIDNTLPSRERSLCKSNRKVEQLEWRSLLVRRRGMMTVMVGWSSS